jgi:hypothetical protein
MSALYAGLIMTDNKDDWLTNFDDFNGRMYMTVSPSGSAGYNPTDGSGGAAIVFKVLNAGMGAPWPNIDDMMYMDLNGIWFYDNASQIRPHTDAPVLDATPGGNYLGDATHRFRRVYSRRFSFDDTYYFWLDPGGPPTVNLQAGNFHVNGDIGCNSLDAAIHIIVAGNTFTPQTITYKDGSGANQTRTFLMV